MVQDGFENFRMYPIAETTRDTHYDAERYFIDIFNSIENGYNINKVKPSTKFKTIGTIHDAQNKRLRSEPVLCINLNKEEIIFSDSMKLFADYMNSSKDMIKNCVRAGRAYKGWFIFYIDNNKRELILYKHVLGDNLSKNYTHSEKSKAFYKDLCLTISSYLKSPNKNEFFPNFKILDSLIYKD
jgi:hypothetical protein